MEKIKLAENIYLKRKHNSFAIEKDGTDKIFPITNDKNVYINLNRGNPATNEEEALRREGDDVIVLRTEDRIRYAQKLGILVEYTEEDVLQKAREISSLFFEEVFDSLDEFSYEFNIRLSSEEWESVKELFNYDADCEAWITREPQKVFETLAKTEGRFRDIAKAMITNRGMELYFAQNYRNYVKLYDLQKYVVESTSFGDWGWDDYYKLREKYDFPKKHEGKTITSNSNLAGYNLGTITFEEGEKYNYIEKTEACPPDDWQGLAVVISKESVNYEDLIRIADAMMLVKNNKLFEMGLKYSN